MTHLHDYIENTIENGIKADEYLKDFYRKQGEQNG